jgi:hypothetical protein
MRKSALPSESERKRATEYAAAAFRSPSGEVESSQATSVAMARRGKAQRALTRVGIIKDGSGLVVRWH